MKTFTDNTFDNIEKKFQNDPMKTVGDMYIFFSGDLLLLHCLCCLFYYNRGGLCS